MQNIPYNENRDHRDISEPEHDGRGDHQPERDFPAVLPERTKVSPPLSVDDLDALPFNEDY